MNLTKRTIRGILKQKIGEWLDSIDDEQLRNDISGKVLVTGGSIVSMLLGEKVNDYDVYLKDKDSVVRLANYYLKQFAANPPPRYKGTGAVKMWVSHDDTDVKGRVQLFIKSAGVAGEESPNAEYQYFETVQDVDAAANYVDKVMPNDLTTVVLDAMDAGEPNPESPEYVKLVEEVHKDINAPNEKGRGGAGQERVSACVFVRKRYNTF